MGIEVELANELIKEMNHLIYELLEVPKDVFAEVGLSAFTLDLYEVVKDYPEFGNLDGQRAAAEADFQKLCDAAPNIPVKAVAAISLAYAGVSVCFDARNTEKPDEASIIRSLLSSTKLVGFAVGVIAESPATHEEKRRQALSIAGKMGAQAKHRKPGELKNWAISQATQLRGADAVVARKLAAMLPSELADVSKNPERLIYDTLREAKRTPDSKPAVTGD